MIAATARIRSKGGDGMIIHEGFRSWTFDETLERDPADRAVVDKMCQYAEERDGTAMEFDGTEDGPNKSNFVFGWKGGM